MTTMSSPGEVLEQAIVADADDLAAHAAYADWLIQQGDPRGEFIQVQLALEEPGRSPEERKRLQQREQSLLGAHREEWVGKWAALAHSSGPEGRGQLDFPGPKPYRFIRGILAEITIDEITLACARALIRAPQTRLVRRLFIGGWAYEQSGTYDPAGDPIPDDSYDPSRHVFSRWPYFENLRVFQLGWTSDENYEDFCHFQCHLRAAEAYELIARMPRLEELYLFADGVPTEQVFQLDTLTNLRALQIYHCWQYPLQVLARNAALRRLTHLLLHPKAAGEWSHDEPPYIKLEGVRAVLQSPYLTNLTHLRLRLTDIGDRGCEEIVQSGILRRLKVLDLRHGCITDAGAHILAACPDVKNLEFLDVSRNQLTRQGMDELMPVVKALDAAYQHEGQTDNYGGDIPDYLFQGDYE
jgi:uncharacterized protein (TIGR02996 family)